MTTHVATSTRFFMAITCLSLTIPGCAPSDPSSQANTTDAVSNLTTATNRASQKLTDIDPNELQSLVAQTLQYNLDARLLSAERNAAWQVFHGLLPYGRDLPLQVGDQRLSALDYLLAGGELAGWELFPGTSLSDSRTGVRSRVEANGYISQGHVDQWLAILAQLDVPLTQKVVVAGKDHTLADWIDQSQFDTPNNPLDEFSWTLIATLHYRPDMQKWNAADGVVVELADIIQYEADQDITSSACGGTHRLMSLAKAVEYGQKNALDSEPAYSAANNTLQKHLQLIKAYQNGDGSFSSNYFDRPGTSADLSIMISATGHQLELAAYALPAEELRSPWMQRAVYRLCKLLEATQDQPLECGGLYHGLNGLRIYHDRAFGKWEPTKTTAQ